MADRIVLRSLGSVWIFGALSLLLVMMLVDAIARGASGFALGAAPFIFLVIWIAYMLLARSCVVVTPSELIVVNIARTHRVPWARITDLTSRFQLTVHCDDGRDIRSWGAPSIGAERPTITTAHARQTAREQIQRAAGVRRRTVRATPSVPVSRLIGQAHDRWELSSALPADATGQVTARLAVFPLAVGAVLVVLCALQLLLH